jgi:hypothetical protein
VARVQPKPDIQKVLLRVERSAERKRRVMGGFAVVATVLAGIVGYAIGQGADPAPSDVVRVSDGVPGDAASGTPIAPEDSALATAAIAKAFGDAFDGGSPPQRRIAAVQDGKPLEPLRAETLALAVQRGFTQEQLAAETVAVHDVSLVDRTHAIVRFTISVPPKGPVLVDQIGYAVLEDGRWQVSLRTACDLLSLGGLGKPCPPP